MADESARWNGERYVLDSRSETIILRKRQNSQTPRSIHHRPQNQNHTNSNMARPNTLHKYNPPPYRSLLRRLLFNYLHLRPQAPLLNTIPNPPLANKHRHHNRNLPQPNRNQYPCLNSNRPLSSPLRPAHSLALAPLNLNTSLERDKLEPDGSLQPRPRE